MLLYVQYSFHLQDIYELDDICMGSQQSIYSCIETSVMIVRK